MTTTEEILKICNELPADKQAEIVDFARFLLARQQDAAWEAELATNKPRPKFDKFLRESALEGDSPLDENRL